MLSGMFRLLAIIGFWPHALTAQTVPVEPRAFLPTPFDRYFARRDAELSGRDWLTAITPDAWPAIQKSMRMRLREMLGLAPWPQRTDLHPVITGTIAGDGYLVEKLHFQSMPGLYVTANLYRPAQIASPLPAILYLCGHAKVIENGVTMGNKTGYQHHGIWFAQHGYVCLVIDTIQLGEISGTHHGTNHLNRWWWPARGYTPAGVETWNGIRALDYLESRPEVDATRMGVTGRSGGGAYSWWIAGLDDRVKVAVPVAGITTLKNHVIEGAIEGHCDCMFMVNTERWDFDRVAALMAPRPLLISNTDKDEIFPLDGVMEIYNRTRVLYQKLGHEDRIGLHLAEGPHKDTQPLNVGAFHWFERFFKGTNRLDVIDDPARKAHAPADLKVFAQLPTDEKVTSVDDSFVPAFVPQRAPLPPDGWAQQRNVWMRVLREQCFHAWPAEPSKAAARKKGESTAEGLRLTMYDLVTEEPFEFRLWLLQPADLKREEVEFTVLQPLDEQGWKEFRRWSAVAFPNATPSSPPDHASFEVQRKILRESRSAIAFFCPRGVGPTSWNNLSERKQTHLRRRLLLIGESLESGQVWDIHQALTAVKSLPEFGGTRVHVKAHRAMAANALYASLFIEDVPRLDLVEPPVSHRDGPTYLNVLRHLDIPQAVRMAAERSAVTLLVADPQDWSELMAAVPAPELGAGKLQILGLSSRN